MQPLGSRAVSHGPPFPWAPRKVSSLKFLNLFVCLFDELPKLVKCCSLVASGSLGWVCLVVTCEMENIIGLLLECWITFVQYSVALRRRRASLPSLDSTSFFATQKHCFGTQPQSATPSQWWCCWLPWQRCLIILMIKQSADNYCNDDNVTRVNLLQTILVPNQQAVLWHRWLNLKNPSFIFFQGLAFRKCFYLQ